METEFSTNLEPSQTELLAWLAEECGEVVQMVGKILRHGYESYHPARRDGPSNRQKLAEELGNLRLVQIMLIASGDLDVQLIEKSFRAKMDTASKYLHFNQIED